MRTERFDIEEISGDRYASLEAVQQAALGHLADLVASIVRQGIEDGSFVVVDGVVRPSHRCESKQLGNRGFTNGKKGV